jgi:putative peptidoglycan lipid II flippase
MSTSDQQSQARGIKAQFSRWWLWFESILNHEFSITHGSLLIMASFLVSAALGIVRQALFNATFGTGFEANAYYAAFRLPDTLVTLIAGGTLTNALIPVLLATAHRKGEAAGQHLINLVLTALVIFVSVCTLLGLIFAPWFVNVVLAPGFDQATSELTVTLTRITLFEVLIIAVSSVCTAMLNSRNRFLLPTLGIAIHNITLIGGILLGAAVPAIGIYGPAVGTIFDALLQFVIMIPGLRRLGWCFKPAWNLGDSDLREVVRLLIPNGLSGMVNYAGGIVDTRYGSLINNAAGLPALNNALLLIGLPIRLLGMAIAQATFPRLAAQVAEENWPRLRYLIKRALLVSFGLGVLALIGLVVVGHPLIKLLFERGRFDAEASALTYQLLVVYAIGLPAYIGTEIITRCLIALHDTRTPLLTNCLQLAGRIALIPLWDESLGIAAIPLAFAVTSIGETLLLGSVLWYKIRKQG